MLHPDFARLAEEDRQTAEVRLGRALRCLTSTLSFMQTGAHPDDEASGLLALLAFRDGHRTSFACSTHGDGGQNSIGREKGLDLAMIRTREMEEAARVLGLRLYWFSDRLDDSATFASRKAPRRRSPSGATTALLNAWCASSAARSPTACARPSSMSAASTVITER
jgi:GlcNAc-PI de-N-acetylase